MRWFLHVITRLCSKQPTSNDVFLKSPLGCKLPKNSGLLLRISLKCIPITFHSFSTNYEKNELDFKKLSQNTAFFQVAFNLWILRVFTLGLMRCWFSVFVKLSSLHFALCCVCRKSVIITERRNKEKGKEK